MQERLFVQPIMAEAIHIDTIRIGHACQGANLPTPLELRKLGFDLSFRDRANNEITTAHSRPYKSESNEPYIHIVRSENPSCYSGIDVECSFAKLVNKTGLGTQTDEDIEYAFDTLESFVYHKATVNFDARTARVKRFDVNVDFRVGEDRIRLYLDSISRPDSRLIPSTHGSTSNYYYNKSRTFAIYAKKAEMEKQFRKGKITKEELDAAEGLLRIEKRLKTPQVINRFADKVQSTNEAGDMLKMSIASKLINETVSELDLERPRFSKEARNHLLLKHFGNRAAEMRLCKESRRGDEILN